MTAAPTGILERARSRHAAPTTNLLEGLIVVQGSSQTPDRDFIVVIGAFP